MADINDVLEIVQFIKDNAASKQDMAAMEVRLDSKIDGVRTELKKDMREMKDELVGHIDGLTKLNEKFDHELVVLREKVERHDEILSRTIQTSPA